jgi:glycosyltransferase involved in cell wall biosynthesis
MKTATEVRREEEARLEEMKPDIAYYGYCGAFGLAEAARSNAIALQWTGYRVARMAASESGPQKREIPCPLVIHHWHPEPGRSFERYFTEYEQPQKRVAYWIWEAENTFHPGMVEHSKYFDEFWTASEYAANLLKPIANGKPVRVIPHAVTAPPHPPKERGAMFRVLYPFDAWSRFSRKNPQAGIDAFQQAFPADAYQNCQLILKTHHLDAEHRRVIEDYINDDRIQIIDDFLSEREIQHLFLESDAVMSLHRSEGFGLNLARAIAYGIPLIGTNYGGCAEFLNNSWKVDWSPIEQGHKDYYDVGSWWAEPNKDQAAAHLRDIYYNPSMSQQRAQDNQICSDFSMDTLASRFSSALNDIGLWQERDGIITALKHQLH